MPYRRMLLPAALLCALCAAPLAAPGQASAQDPGNTVAAACSACHNTKRVCAHRGVKDKAAWDATVTRMIDKGAKVDAKAKGAVVDWLAVQKPGAKPVCE